MQLRTLRTKVMVARPPRECSVCAHSAYAVNALHVCSRPIPQATLSIYILTPTEGEYGDEGSPFVQLLKQYMTRDPAAPVAAGDTLEDAGGGRNSLTCKGGQAAAHLLELAARAAEALAKCPTSAAGGSGGGFGSDSGSAAKAAEAWAGSPAAGSGRGGGSVQLGSGSAPGGLPDAVQTAVADSWQVGHGLVWLHGFLC